MTNLDEMLPTVAKAANTAMLLVLAVGIWYRRRPAVHIPLMLVAFAVDLANVLVVEYVARRQNSQGKGAVEQAADALTQGASALALVHIAVSVLCMLGYVVALFTGIRLYRHGRGRRAHQVNAGIFIVTRLTSYVTSFWM